jgi:methylenetetrahydrofolate dehydrogenase (NADP+)/methenyltetrahydrofolate cyclohydrolase
MIIDGKQLAEQILEELSIRVAKLKEQKNIIPHLAVIRVGEDPATTSYVNQKKRMGEKIGGTVSIYNFDENVTQEKVLECIDFLQKHGGINGLIVQLPLPPQLNENLLTRAVDRDKDVDGFREDSEFNEPIAEAALKILEEVFLLEKQKENNTAKEFVAWLKPQKIVVMGKGKTGGKPIINILKKLNIVPLIIDSKTPNIEELTRSADILVCAVGKGKIITEAMIKKDAILLGIGMHKEADGKLHGDYDAEEIAEKAAYYTPIPGGVGPVNAAMLLVNVVNAMEH